MDKEFIKAIRLVLELAKIANNNGSTKDRVDGLNAIQLVTRFVDAAEQSHE